MTVRLRLHGAIAAVLLVLLVAPACSAEPAPATATASVDEPAHLTEDQAELLAAMPYKNYATGITAFNAHLLGGQSGDMIISGWIDFTQRTGVATATPSGAPPMQIVWDSKQIAFADLLGAAPGTTPPALPLADGDWRIVAFDPGASELTRLLAAMLLLSSDRPDNPLLVKQNGARYLGAQDLDGAVVHRFSGVSAEGAGGHADLGTQYWLDENGALVRFGFRADASGLSTVDFDRSAEAPDSIPPPDAAGGDEDGE